MVTIDDRAPGWPRVEPKALLGDPAPTSAMVLLVVGVVVPFAALLAAVPVAWGWGLSWLDIVIALVFYLVSGFGVTVGFHRYFTHGAFKAQRWLRVTLAVAGSLLASFAAAGSFGSFSGGGCCARVSFIATTPSRYPA